MNGDRGPTRAAIRRASAGFHLEEKPAHPVIAFAAFIALGWISAVIF